MKKCDFYVLLGINIIIFALFEIVLYFSVPVLNVIRTEVIAYTLLIVLAFTLLVRGLVLKIDSSLFASVVLIGICVIGYVVAFSRLTYAMLWQYYFLVLAFANFSVRIVFFDRLQGFLGIISSGFFVFSLLFNLNFYGILWYIVLDIIWVLTCMLIFSKIIRN